MERGTRGRAEITDEEALVRAQNVARSHGAFLSPTSLRITFATGRTWEPLPASSRSRQIRDAWHVLSKLSADPDPEFLAPAIADGTPLARHRRNRAELLELLTPDPAVWPRRH
jgi:hypothetical protein